MITVWMMNITQRTHYIVTILLQYCYDNRKTTVSVNMVNDVMDGRQNLHGPTFGCYFLNTFVVETGGESTFSKIDDNGKATLKCH